MGGLDGWLNAGEWEAIRLSLLVSVVAVVGSLPFGVALGWLLARHWFRGKAVIETLVNLTLVLPPVVTGYLLLVTFGSHGWIGRFLLEGLGIRIVFTWKAAALASAIVSFPLMVRAIRVAFTTVDPRLEGVGRTLGAGPLDTFFSVTLPLARHGVIAGCVLAFARSMGEFGATIMFAGNFLGRTQTMPLAILTAMESDVAAALGLGLMLLVASAFVLVILGLVARARFNGPPGVGP